MYLSCSMQQTNRCTFFEPAIHCSPPCLGARLHCAAYLAVHKSHSAAMKSSLQATHQLPGHLQTLLQVQCGTALHFPFARLCCRIPLDLLSCPARQDCSAQVITADHQHATSGSIGQRPSVGSTHRHSATRALLARASGRVDWQQETHSVILPRNSCLS